MPEQTMKPCRNDIFDKWFADRYGFLPSWTGNQYAYGLAADSYAAWQAAKADPAESLAFDEISIDVSTGQKDAYCRAMAKMPPMEIQTAKGVRVALFEGELNENPWQSQLEAQAEQIAKLVDACKLADSEFSHLKHQIKFRDGGSVDRAWWAIKTALAKRAGSAGSPKHPANVKNLSTSPEPVKEMAISLHKDGGGGGEVQAAEQPEDCGKALREILYPNGLKHPQQGEWYWMLKRVKELLAKPRAIAP